MNGLRPRRVRMGLAGWLGSCLLGALAGPAHANDFDQFQNARVAYESANYELAADLFQGLLAGESDDDVRPLVIESRKYLAATYLFLQRPGDAEQQLRRLLSAEPDYVLDPLAFPAEFVKLFARVQRELEAARERAERERARLEARRQAEYQVTDLERQRRLRRLIELASIERVEQRHSRWIAMLPFGIGQFQNDHDGLGLVLAVSQATLLATGLISYAAHADLRGQDPLPEDRDNAELAEAASRYINQISLGLFAVLAVTGILDAQIRFRPSRTYEQPRVLPPELRDLELSIGPGGLRFQARF